MAGGARLGNCAIGRLVIESVPASMMKMAMTHAKTGRSMKNLDIKDFLSSGVGLAGARRCSRRLWGRRDFDLHARAELLEVIDDDLVARLQAGCDQPLIADR